MNQATIPPAAESAPAKSAETNSWTVVFHAEGVKSTSIDCEPGDLNNYWTKLTPATFLCEGLKTYTFRAPQQEGYSTFRHWWHPRTETVVSTSPDLEVTLSKRNERYVAVYNTVVPVDVAFTGTTRKEEIPVTASVPDINGKTSLVTPDKFTYLTGTRVTFSVLNECIKEHPDVLYGKVQEIRTFLRWEENTAFFGKDRDLTITIDRPRQLQALYAQSPKPQTPNDRQVFVMGQQLLHELEKGFITRGVVVLINNKLTPILGRLVFPSQEKAEASIQAAIGQVLPNWLQQIPEGWRDWMKDKGQQDKFLKYWQETMVKIVPVEQLNFNR